MKPKIYLSAGHQVKGNKGNGAINEFGDEAIITSILRNLIFSKTICRNSHYSLICDWNYMTLTDVIEDINRQDNIDLALELHFNSVSDSSSSGTLAIIFDKNCIEARRYADELCKLTANVLGTKNLGSRTMSSLGRNLAFLRKTKCPAVILEICFLSNKSDMDKFWTKWNSLCQQLCDYFDTL